ncbi:MAG TPA: RNA polymerase sigma factor [Pleomorphomonadaceae bacterium]|nr:RNA polymerase sigma factor [Pleomorphomonadaceae bacterium]
MPERQPLQRPAHRPAPETHAPGDPDLADVRAAQRDPHAFDRLYRRYLDQVYSYAFYQLGDHHDAEDATERTFLAALAAIDRFHDEGSTFRAWLFRIAHNAIANSHRTRRRRRTEPITNARQQAAPGADPAGVVARADQQREIRAALARLPAERRQAILLRFVDELSAREIGAVLDRSEGAARVLLHRALRDLADQLDRGDA